MKAKADVELQNLILCMTTFRRKAAKLKELKNGRR